MDRTALGARHLVTDPWPLGRDAGRPHPEDRARHALWCHARVDGSDDVQILRRGGVEDIADLSDRMREHEGETVIAEPGGEFLEHRRGGEVHGGIDSAATTTVGVSGTIASRTRSRAWSRVPHLIAGSAYEPVGEQRGDLLRQPLAEPEVAHQTALVRARSRRPARAARSSVGPAAEPARSPCRAHSIVLRARKCSATRRLSVQDRTSGTRTPMLGRGALVARQ